MSVECTEIQFWQDERSVRIEECCDLYVLDKHNTTTTPRPCSATVIATAGAAIIGEEFFRAQSRDSLQQVPTQGTGLLPFQRFEEVVQMLCGFTLYRFNGNAALYLVRVSRCCSITFCVGFDDYSTACLSYMFNKHRSRSLVGLLDFRHYSIVKIEVESTCSRAVSRCGRTMSFKVSALTPIEKQVVELFRIRILLASSPFLHNLPPTPNNTHNHGGRSLRWCHWHRSRYERRKALNARVYTDIPQVPPTRVWPTMRALVLRSVSLTAREMDGSTAC